MNLNWKIGLLGLLVAALVIGAGCIYGPKRVTYNVIAGTEITVDTAMQLWGEYVKEFHPPVSQEKQVADAYAHYQLAEEEVIDAARLTITLTGSGNTNGIANAQSRQSAATAQAAQAFADLLKLLRQFGVKV